MRAKTERLWQKGGYTGSVAFSPDGKHVATSVGSGGVTVFNLLGESSHQFGFTINPIDLVFAPDGRHLLTANTNGTIYILRLLRLSKLAEHSQPKK